MPLQYIVFNCKEESTRTALQMVQNPFTDFLNLQPRKPCLACLCFPKVGIGCAIRVRCSFCKSCLVAAGAAVWNPCICLLRSHFSRANELAESKKPVRCELNSSLRPSLPRENSQTLHSNVDYAVVSETLLSDLYSCETEGEFQAICAESILDMVASESWTAGKLFIQKPPLMAVTHADLAPSRSSTELGSKAGTVLLIICILCGLFCFILCLIAEATRSMVTWNSTGEGKHPTKECIYSGSGKTPLLCAGSAFLGLAVVMVVEHTYMLVAVSKSTPPVLITWDPDSSSAKALTWQAGFFFISTWIFFAVGEILLLIGVSVESGHLKNWSTPRPSCLTIPQGLFSAAGGFWVGHNFPSNRHRIITAMNTENPTARQNHSGQPPSQFSSVFTKHSIDQV
ncbi:hypothetical protein CK203_081077 [Vitis vinifera]|uniref:Uncharacterized protein n=1 Tax=Vitis vinifera TaxID=29760 RepID=A0A438DWR3_VITVI|nr:hypothetical protein CK203_081077 [Vitis vinifera]